jgi:NAD(P)-dependent dehydrogenase (short-subunit alcohol dehydrogenase family)
VNEAVTAVALVTGGAGGIGRETVRRLAEDGFEVVSLDLHHETPGERHASTVTYDVDVTNSTAVQACVDDVIRRFGRIDALVNNAALLECFAVHDTPEDVWDRVLAVNLKGAFLAARACLPHLCNRPHGAGIVNVSSVHALASVPRTAAYAASKGALLSLTRQMAVDYADAGVRVNAVVVGSVDTPMSARHGAEIARDGVTISPPAGRLGRMAAPAEIAAAISFLLSPSASFMSGSSVVVDGGLVSRLM